LLQLPLLVRFLAWVFRRPRLNVRFIEDEPDKEARGLRFEAENTSPSPSSLDPVLRSRFLYPSTGRMRRSTATLDVRELGRELPSFRAKLFSASARVLPRGYGYAWVRVYRFRVRRGVARRVRIRSALLEPLGTSVSGSSSGAFISAVV